MSSETITRNDLTAILNEVLVNGRPLGVKTVTGTTTASGALLANVDGIFVYAKGTGGQIVLKRTDGYVTVYTPDATGLQPVANTAVTVTIYYIPI